MFVLSQRLRLRLVLALLAAASLPRPASPEPLLPTPSPGLLIGVGRFAGSPGSSAAPGSRAEEDERLRRQSGPEFEFDAATLRRSRRVCRPLGPGAAAAAASSAREEHGRLLLPDAEGLAAAESGDEAAGGGGMRCVRRACVLTRGPWCPAFERQQPLSWRPGKRGDKDCPASPKYGVCNGVGNCNHDIGVCQCPAGWAGPDCATRELRPCTNGHRGAKDPLHEPKSHVGPDGRDLDPLAPGWTASRCGGVCDVDTAACYCPPETKYGRLEAPAGSPPGTPPLRRGRPLETHCQPNQDSQHRNLSWGSLPIDWLTGPDGWCNADHGNDKAIGCGCLYDGLAGRFCDEPVESWCPNQCGGRGACLSGFCKCEAGWYGSDCATARRGLALDAAGMAGNMSTKAAEERPWLVGLAAPVPAAAQVPPPVSEHVEGAAAAAAAAQGGDAAAAAAAVPHRLRPLIFVYDMPPRFTGRMIQYGLGSSACFYRRFGERNRSEFHMGGYSVEPYLHEELMRSPHRTLDPEEADFFYVPVYAACLMWPILGWADAPFWHVPDGNIRVMHAMYLWLDALGWIKEHYGAYWKRRGGRDHIWTTIHDEGACYMPTEIFSRSIMLTHWGRMERNHTSGTAFRMDNYERAFPYPNTEEQMAFMQPLMPDPDWRERFRGHACYDATKDLVIPGFKRPGHYAHSPLLGAPPLVRDILLYFRGDVGHNREPHYSRGVRQKMFKLARRHLWGPLHRIFVLETHEAPGEYSEQLARSVFCLVAPGDGYSMRAEDSVLHGCIPLVIMDNVHAVLESALEWDSFSLRLPESALDERLPELLRAVPPARIARLQHNLAAVMSRFAYGHGWLVEEHFKEVRQRWANHAAQYRNIAPPASHPFVPMSRFPRRHDALSTIIRWLYGRIPHTRQPDPS